MITIIVIIIISSSSRLISCIGLLAGNTSARVLVLFGGYVFRTCFSICSCLCMSVCLYVCTQVCVQMSVCACVIELADTPTVETM